MAKRMPESNEIVSGVLVKNNFSYAIMDPRDLGGYTSLRISSLNQKLSLHYSGSIRLLLFNLQQLNDDAHLVHQAKIKDSKKGTPTHVLHVFAVSEQRNELLLITKFRGKWS